MIGAARACDSTAGYRRGPAPLGDAPQARASVGAPPADRGRCVAGNAIRGGGDSAAPTDSSRPINTIEAGRPRRAVPERPRSSRVRFRSPRQIVGPATSAARAPPHEARASPARALNARSDRHTGAGRAGRPRANPRQPRYSKRRDYLVGRRPGPPHRPGPRTVWRAPSASKPPSPVHEGAKIRRWRAISRDADPTWAWAAGQTVTRFSAPGSPAAARALR